jgi:hypothetical protein
METPTVQPVQEMVKSVSVGKNKVWLYVVGAFVVVILGVTVAWLISSKVINKGGGATPNMKVTSTGAGVLDSSIKYDNATGELKDGGISGQGTHHLVRDGGPSQIVYLTSSVIDLSSFVGKKIQVWGQTLASKKVSWLMDVSKVEVVQ